MRAPFALVVLLVLSLVPVPGAQAEPTFQDGMGDVAVQPAGLALPDNPQMGSTDLLGLDVVEGDYEWTFVLKLASFGQNGGTINQYHLSFTWDDAQYRVSVLRSRFDPTSEPLLRAQLQLADGDAWNKVIDLDVVEDTNAATLTVTFAKLYVASLEGHAPVPGSQLTDVSVRARGDFNFGNGSPVQLVDVMPDDGAGTIVYTRGGTSLGHLALEPMDPVRISNGGSGTFVYTVHVQNRGDVEDEIALAVSDIPEGWTAKVHPRIVVPAHEEKPIVVIATLPFGHTHGGFSAFTLAATSPRDASAKATVQLGVIHTPIPQPAGHHSELYLHAVPSDSGVFGTAFPGTISTMNTVSDHADDSPEAIALVGPEGGAAWRIPLGPQLAMGLDFDTTLAGALEGEVIAKTTGDGELSAQLWLVKGDGDVALLADAAPMPLALDPQNPAPFAFTLTPTPESDLVPYVAGHNLQLRLALATSVPCCAPQAAPAIPVETFRMQLPLNEYHEAPPLNEEGEGAVALVTVAAEGAIEKLARPGATATYAFVVTNGAPQPDDYVVEIEGTAKDAATVAPVTTFRLEPGATQRLVLGLTVPASANDGEVLDALLVVRSTSDPANVAIGRTSTIVSRSDAGPDEIGILDQARAGNDDTPMPGLALVLCVVGALALARRRA